MKDKDKLKQEIAEYEIQKNRFPKDVKLLIESFFEIAGFQFNVVDALKEECLKKLSVLATKQYIGFSDVTDPVIIKFINTINNNAILNIAYVMRGMVKDMNANIDIKVKYPRLEEWRDFYVFPKPHTINENKRNKFAYPDDEEWAQYVKHENREMLRFFCWEEQRRTEFYDIIQSVLFALYPLLNNIEGDFWVLYAVNMRDKYEDWKTSMEDVETKLHYEMPSESVNWEYEKFSNEISKRYDVYGASSTAKRDEQIKSFKLPDE